MQNYKLEGNSYIIEQYDRVAAFSSFLPGLAGIKGIPVWVFYTNRGQGINSFGINNKDQAIMEFNPANTAYENTTLKGFRTFIKKDDYYYEAFSDYSKDTKRTMSIKQNSVQICEVNEKAELEIIVTYYVLPNESIGGLVRNVVVKILSETESNIEILDGMPKIIPYGVKNEEYKNVSNLLKSWSDVKNTENLVPYYTMIPASDEAEAVNQIEGGYFYASILNGEKLPVIYDTDVIFDYDTSLKSPICFLEEGLDSVVNKVQYPTNKIPCGFTPIKQTLKSNEILEFNSCIGFAGSVNLLNEKIEKFMEQNFFTTKKQEAEELIEEFLNDVKTSTASNVFDKYISQCYLDNFLRGGYAYTFNNEENKSVIHLFSRKHGDPERDYNFFSIAGEYYSQGNGNFRDVCQNRRSDVFFNKDIEDFNVKNFFSLIQADGFNPLEIRPSTFTIKEDKFEEAKKLLEKALKENADVIENVIKTNFTPGQISNTIAKCGIEIFVDEDKFIEDIMNISETHLEAGFGEGYWSDHWNYLIDLVENYLMIYPDKEKDLLFNNNTYRYYSSVEKVMPRSKTFVLNNDKVRKYGALSFDNEKAQLEGFNTKGTNWLKTLNGEIIETSLFTKMVVLAVNKFSLLDPYGMGIQMDGGRPGWNDAMNGLPGLFGSGMPETLELVRLISFMIDKLEVYKNTNKEIELPKEIVEFMNKLNKLVISSLENKLTDYEYWDKTSSEREEYIELTRLHLSGEDTKIQTTELLDLLKNYLSKLQQGCNKAFEYGKGIMPTYLTYSAVDYEIIKDENGEIVRSHYGNLPTVKVKEFKLEMLPSFLEGPCKALLTLDKEIAKSMHEKIKNTDIYDEKLKMFKTSGSLENVSLENGRIRAFTPGWLERESIFLHMEYKYFLNLLKAGLYDEYYTSIKDALIPFLDPKIYGRSVLENSSFIASSVNPDPNTHGRGYVARLSGSTIEMLSMWITMFVGNEGGFKYKNEELEFKFAPILPTWLFDDNKEASFTLLSKTKVTYHNESMKNTYGKDSVKVSKLIYEVDGICKEVDLDTIKGQHAHSLREGKIEWIKAILTDF